jgi:hypothetical protein
MELRNSGEFNVRSPHYYVARTETRCFRCSESIEVFALVLPPKHKVTDEEADTGPFWQLVEANAILFCIASVSDAVAVRLRQLSPDYCLVGETTEDAHWANRCRYCARLIDDRELHEEFGGAFVPAEESDAAKITLISVDEPFKACVSGFSLEPEFFRFMRRS